MPVNTRALLRSLAPGDAAPRRDAGARIRDALGRPPGRGRGQPTARVLPPIRTLTVGTGVSPVQPAAGAAGSRTITAGSEFHRPRSTLTSANQCATRDIPDRTPPPLSWTGG